MDTAFFLQQVIVLNNLVNNEYIQTKEIIADFFIKTISIFDNDSDLESFVRKFINIYTFPYINTDYGKIIQNYKADLSDEKKTEITAHLEALLNNLNKAKKTAFVKLKDEEIIELTEADLDELDDKEKLFNNFRGGEYGEMFLSQMLFSLGYEKVCTLDILTLLNYYSKWKNDSKIVDMKNIILNTNYNKPDYNEIINL